jgi:hypothetical protein
MLGPSDFIRCFPIKDQSLTLGANDLRIVMVPCRSVKVQRFGVPCLTCAGANEAYLGGGKEPRENAR